MAPELIAHVKHNEDKVFQRTLATDVYSYASLCLQVIRIFIYSTSRHYLKVCTGLCGRPAAF
jgi:hypothetical protein